MAVTSAVTAGTSVATRTTPRPARIGITLGPDEVRHPRRSNRRHREAPRTTQRELTDRWTLPGVSYYKREVTRLPDEFYDLDNLDIGDAVECVEAVLTILTSVDECLGAISHLEEALGSRDTIGQAKGILMARQGLSANEAFDVLRRASQRSNRRLRDIAADVVAHQRPEQLDP